METHWLFFALVFSMIGPPVASNVLLRDGSVRLSAHRSPFKQLAHPDFQDLFERRLADGAEAVPSQHFRVDRNDDYKKLKFMEIVSSIQKTAKARHLKIKSIGLGRNIRKVFENDDVAKVMNEYVNDPKLSVKLTQERQRKDRIYRARRLEQKRLQKLRTKMRSKSPSPRKTRNMKFQMSGDMSQMPYPPVMMEGPTFHPPMNVTINQLPSMNPRAELNPLALQQKEYEKELDGLSKIKAQLEGTDGALSEFNRLKDAVISSLNEGFNQVQNNALG